MKRSLLPIIVLVALAIGIMLSAKHWQIRKKAVTPAIAYSNKRDLELDIVLLPEIGATKQTKARDWAPYIRVARRVAVTDPIMTRDALEELSHDNRSGAQMGIKMMLLIRVCFECPTNALAPGRAGGWLSYSQMDAGQTTRDMNWPVERRFRGLALTDTVDGYLGRPYNAAAELDWMLRNCWWRDLR